MDDECLGEEACFPVSSQSQLMFALIISALTNGMETKMK